MCECGVGMCRGVSMCTDTCAAVWVVWCKHTSMHMYMYACRCVQRGYFRMVVPAGVYLHVEAPCTFVFRCRALCVCVLACAKVCVYSQVCIWVAL